MKNRILLFIALTCTLSTLNAQNYTTGFDNADEQAGWVEYELGSTNQFLYWEFAPFMPYTAPNCLAHYYPVGGTTPTDDWIVSPLFDFSNGGAIDSLRYKFSGFGTPMAGDTIAVYLLNGSSHPDSATSKTILINYADSSYSNDNVWRLDSAILIPAIEGASYIAFRYVTTINWLDVAFDNLSISANSPNNIMNTALATELKLYPNPSSDLLFIELSKNEPIKSITFFNVSGAIVKQFNPDESSINVKELNAGSYFLQVKTSQGIHSKKVLIN